MDLVILCGLQASGKSTYRALTFDATHVVVSKDLMGRNRKIKGEYQKQLIRESFEAGRSVVVDNTNPAVEDRAPLIALGREYSARVLGYHFKSTWEQSMERNSRRTGRAQVPYVALASTSKRFVAPILSEGFDELYEVVLGQEGPFIEARVG
jgi:predicted kinase